MERDPVVLDCIRSASPQHQVVITQPFYLGTHEVRQSDYESVMGSNPSHFASTGLGKEAVAGLEVSDHPVERVMWNDAAEFCAKASILEKHKPYYFRAGDTIAPLDGTGYRLPTEAEWEWACRAGITSQYWTGEKTEDLIKAAWVGINSAGRTHAVGELKANHFGLYDIHGNVVEWTQDWLGSDYYKDFENRLAVDPTGPRASTAARVLRGGYLSGHEILAASSYRQSVGVNEGPYENVGFRVVLTVKAVRQSLKAAEPVMASSTTGNIPNNANASETLPVTYTNSLGMEFVKVPKGTGWLGGGGGKPGEQKVEFTDDFYLGKYEVTQEEWEKVTGLNPSWFSRNGGGKDAVKDISDADVKRLPVEWVSWVDCQLFLERVNRLAAETGWHYRLPTESEWEYASRGGPGDRLDSTFNFDLSKPVNEVEPGQVAPATDIGRTWKVGEFLPNRLGIHDLFGNVEEWCDDEIIVPTGSEDASSKGERWYRVRGSAAGAPVTFIDQKSESYRYLNIGLRLARVRVSPSKRLSSGTDAPIDFDIERKIAQRLLRLGKGSVTLGNKDRQGFFVGPLKEPLPAEPFCILGIGMDGTDVTDDELAALKGCQAIEGINVAYTKKLTAAGLTQLGTLPHLKALLIHGSKIDEKVIPWLVQLPALESFNAVESRISSKALATLPPCPRLRHFETYSADDEAVRRISVQCPELRHLLCNWSVNDFKPLKKLTRLQSLHCTGNILSESSIDVLSELPFLEHLMIEGADKAGLERLKSRHLRLTVLVLRNIGGPPSSTTSEAWMPVTEMPSLRRLQLTQAVAVDGPSLQRIAAMRNLKQLTVVEDAPTEFRTFTAEDVKAFRKARPDVELLIGGKTYPALADWPGKFEGSTSIADANLPAGAPELAVIPFSAEQAKQHQEAWAKFLGREVEETNSLGMKFKLIPPSESIVNIGTSDDPQMSLQRVEKPYYMGTTEVTVAQFKKFVEVTGYVTDAERDGKGGGTPESDYFNTGTYTWKRPWKYLVDDSEPVTQVSFFDMVQFCNWLAQKDKVVYRLPNIQEWIFAAKAGRTEFDCNLHEYAWCEQSSDSENSPLHPVGLKNANAFGLFDFEGNVAEIVQKNYRSIQVGSYALSNRMPADMITNQWDGEASRNCMVGFRVVRQIESSPVVETPKFGEQPVLVARNTPLGPQATVTRPAPIAGVRSWTIELAAHQGQSGTIAWSPKGDLIATMGSDRTVRLWDRNGKLKSVLLGHVGETYIGQFASFSPDGNQLATVDFSNDPVRPSTLRIWQIKRSDGKGLSVISAASFPLQSWGHCVAWSTDGQHVAVVGTNGVSHVINIAAGIRYSMPVVGEPMSVAWSPDGRFLLVPSSGTPRVLDFENAMKATDLTAPDGLPAKDQSQLVGWSPDGRLLAFAAGNRLYLWDAHSLQHLRMIETDVAMIHTLSWNRDSEHLAVGGEGGPASLQIIHVSSGQIETSNRALGGLTSLAWSPDGTEIAVAGQPLRFIDGTTGKITRVGELRGEARGSSDQHFPLYSRFAKGEINYARNGLPERLTFDSESGKLLDRKKLTGNSGDRIAVASDDSWQAYQDENNKVHVEPKRFDRDLISFLAPGRDWRWRSSPTGDRIAQAFEKQVCVWDTSNGNRLLTLEHPAKVWSLEFSPDGKQIATIAEDKMIRIWDAVLGTVVHETHHSDINAFYYFWRGAPILAWTANGQGLWVPLGVNASLLDVKTGTLQLVANFSFANLVGSLTLAPDGDRLLVREECRTWLRDRDGSRHFLGEFLGVRPQWHSDARRFLSDQEQFGIRGYDVETRRRLGTLWPELTGNHWLCVGPTGHYRGSDGVEEHFVYVAQLDDGSHVTLSPADFAKRFNWQNDPNKASLLKLDVEP